MVDECLIAATETRLSTFLSLIPSSAPLFLSWGLQCRLQATLLFGGDLVMEAEWFAQRAALRCLARQHPTWTQEAFAATLGRSRSWVAKWLTRFKEATPDDLAILHARSRARHTPPPSTPINAQSRR
jgi:hypothetical protein